MVSYTCRFVVLPIKNIALMLLIKSRGRAGTPLTLMVLLLIGIKINYCIAKGSKVGLSGDVTCFHQCGLARSIILKGKATCRLGLSLLILCIAPTEFSYLFKTRNNNYYAHVLT